MLRKATIIVPLLFLILGTFIYKEFIQYRHRIIMADGMREVSFYLSPKIDWDNNTFPEKLDFSETILHSQSEKRYTIKKLLYDPVSHKECIYRVITKSKEVIKHHQGSSTRFILWSPEANFKGKRMIMLNNLCIFFVEDKYLDFDNQTVTAKFNNF